MADVPDPPFPRALPAPDGPVLALTPRHIQQAVEASRLSPRRRIILPFHQGPTDTLHRMLNALQPGSYVRPHRHLEPPKPESVVILRGAVRFVHFGDEGRVLQVFDLSAEGGAFGADARAGTFHTFFALRPDSVVFEVKPGPYEPTSDKDFAPWAPEEGSPGAAPWLEQLLARTGGVGVRG